MTNHHRTIALACALLALPALLAPTASAGLNIGLLAHDDPQYTALRSVGLGDAADSGCKEQSTPMFTGYIAITHLGSFQAEGQYTDGCGGQGCDNRLTGEYYANGAWHPFGLVETGWDNTDACGGYCYDDGASDNAGRYPTIRYLPNGSDADSRPHFYFACGNNEPYSGPWSFGGRLYLNDPSCDSDHGQPACDQYVQWVL